ncbi:hypothetical protein Leryth_000069 [Lithospermum erythrorhizon]|nr:hypothetical protein Leryth_000069 [Lithospermum erythrorhizon]
MTSSSSEVDGDGGVPPPRFESQIFGSFPTSYEEEKGESTLVKGGSDDVDLFGSKQINGSQLSSSGGNGPVLPPPEGLEKEEEGVALKEWRRQNAIRLEEKEKREKEILNEIIDEAEEYKAEFYNKWKVNVENNKATNREKEKLMLENQEKFHAEASKNYFKAAAEMIPREVPTIEKKGKKKDQEKMTSVVVIHGPKPGKPTDLSRMRQVFLKLKQKPPPHMNPTPSTPSSNPVADLKAGASSSASVAPLKSQAMPAPKSVTAE